MALNIGPGDLDLPIKKTDMFPDRGLPAQPPKRPSAVAGRKKCDVCGRLPNSMTEHWAQESASHGPMSTENPAALRNLPGLDQLSKHLGGIFTDRRM